MHLNSCHSADSLCLVSLTSLISLCSLYMCVSTCRRFSISGRKHTWPTADNGRRGMIIFHITCRYHAFISCIHIMWSYFCVDVMSSCISYNTLISSYVHVMSWYQVFDIVCLISCVWYHVLISCVGIVSCVHMLILCVDMMPFISCVDFVMRAMRVWTRRTSCSSAPKEALGLGVGKG